MLSWGNCRTLLCSSLVLYMWTQFSLESSAEIKPAISLERPAYTFFIIVTRLDYSTARKKGFPAVAWKLKPTPLSLANFFHAPLLSELQLANVKQEYTQVNLPWTICS